jgi:hypothetical protein
VDLGWHLAQQQGLDALLAHRRLTVEERLEHPHAATADGNNTAAYVCRAARGQTKWSQHAYGTAVDINPFHNPLVKRDLVIPELASAYVPRSAVRPGMHVAGGPAVRAFEAIGWSWGGTWRSSKDWMHFSLTGGVSSGRARRCGQATATPAVQRYD